MTSITFDSNTFVLTDFGEKWKPIFSNSNVLNFSDGWQQLMKLLDSRDISKRKSMTKNQFVYSL